jgi:glycosyltransferase involved in cell wall biosynthesis
MQKVEQAVFYFLNQTYDNKELIIVSQECNLDVLESRLKAIGRISEQIHFVQVPPSPKITLGELRNISIENAHGEYFCQWDDDDWYHQDRIRLQLAASLKENLPVNMIAHLLIFDAVKKDVYLSRAALWEPSIFCRRDIVTAERRYPSLSKSEDSAFVDALPRALVHSVHLPQLYVYIYHGNNTWDQKHFNKMFFRGQKLDNKTASAVADILNNKYSYTEASELMSSINFENIIERVSEEWFHEPGYCLGPHR